MPFLNRSYVQKKLGETPPRYAVDNEAAFTYFSMWRLNRLPEKIYIAASIAAILPAAQLALQLVNAGFKVTSSWLGLDHAALKAQGEANEKDYISIQKTFGAADLRDLELADTLIVLTDIASTSGGLYVELGHFLAQGDRKNIIVVGPRLNVFFWLPCIRITPYTDGLIEWLQHPDHGKK